MVVINNPNEVSPTKLIKSKVYILTNQLKSINTRFPSEQITIPQNTLKETTAKANENARYKT